MNDQIQKQLKKVFLDLERDLREFEKIYTDIEESLSHVVEGWNKFRNQKKSQMISEIMRRAMNNIGMCYTDQPTIWTGAEDMAFTDLCFKIRNLLSVIDNYNKNK